MAQPVLLGDLLPALLAAMRPALRVAPAQRAAHAPAPPRRDGLSQVLAHVERLTRPDAPSSAGDR